MSLLLASNGAMVICQSGLGWAGRRRFRRWRRAPGGTGSPGPSSL